jgi:tetratricopeptide (TPR) repeat protein
MEIRLPCECGQQVPVTAQAIGGVIQCTCGRIVQVPSLAELKTMFPVGDVSQSGGRENPPETGSPLPLPRSVKVLGSLYLLVGGLGLFQTIWGACQGAFSLSVLVIALPLGVGLLCGSSAWRKLALFAAVVQILFMGLMVYLFCRFGEDKVDMPADLSSKIGPPFSKVVLAALAALTAAALMISIWSIYLLTRKRVRSVFQQHVSSRRRFGLVTGAALILFLTMIARETGGFSLHYFKWSEEEPQREKREEASFRVVLGDSVAGDPVAGEGDNRLQLPDFEGPCLIEIRGLGDEWFGVATFNVKRDFYAGGGSTDTHGEWKTYGGRAVSEVSPSLRNCSDRIVVEVDQPQFSGEYWLPLYKNFTAEYRARIHGEGKYATYQDQMNEKRDVTIYGLCSVHDLKKHLLGQAKDTAIKKIMNRAEQSAKHATWLLSEGAKAAARKEYDRAITIYTEAMRLIPEDAHVFRERGDAWSGKGEWDQAIKDYDEVIRLSPEETFSDDRRSRGWVHKKDAFNNRGWAWYKKKDYDRAIQDLDEAIALDPKYTRAFRNRATVLEDKQDYDKAIKDYDEAIRQEPDYVESYNDRGLLWGRKQDYDKAIKDFDEAIRLNRRYVYAFNNRGNAWRDKHDYDRAILDYDDAVRQEPNYTIAIYNRGLTWSLMKDYDNAGNDYIEASRQFDEAIREGQRTPYNVVLGYLAATQAGDKPAAERFLEDYIDKLDETWPYPVVQFLRGDIDEPALLKLSTDDAKRTDTHCVLGVHYAIQGHKDEALAHFRWVTDHGRKTFMAYTIAVTELDRLEQRTGDSNR